MQCLICQKPELETWNVSAKPARTYFRCHSCEYLFMNPAERLTHEEETARYQLHQNQDTTGYRNFFKPLVDAIERHRSDDALQALDFGCGPEPVLADLLVDQAWDVQTYDPVFCDKRSVLDQRYDLVTCTEVWEHLHAPTEILKKLNDLLKPGGLVAVMTSAYADKNHFENWWYRRDLTHVGFFTETTMKTVARQMGWDLIEAKSPYWVFQKKTIAIRI